MLSPVRRIFRWWSNQNRIPNSVENIVEYLLDPINKGLKDMSPYVRKTAVMCTVKLHMLSPRLAASDDFFFFSWFADSVCRLWVG